MFIAGNRMIDCAKGLAELASLEGCRCFIDSLGWPDLAYHVEQIWTAVMASAWAQWTVLVGTVVVIVPTVALSWLLSFSLVAGLYDLAAAMAGPRSNPTSLPSWNQSPTRLVCRASFFKSRTALIMLIGGLILGIAGVADHEVGFKLIQGGWEIACAAALYVLPLSWWSSTYLVTGEVHPAWRSLGEIVATLADLLQVLTFLDF